MAIQQNYKVPVYIDGKVHSSVFYRTDTGQFDLRYGWAKYTSGMHSNIKSANADFLQHLKAEYPDHEVLLGEAVEITEDEARKLSPTYELPRNQSQRDATEN